MCWQTYPGEFTADFVEKVGACAFSVYQALSPPLKGPGDEAYQLFDFIAQTSAEYDIEGIVSRYS